MAATVTYVPQEQIERFRELQNLPYEIKVQYAMGKAQEFYDALEGKVFCSVGGLDSITLLLFLRKYVSPDIPGVTISSLEDKTVQAVHKQLWKFWMYDMGWGKVLDYIGVAWENEYVEPPQQMELFGGE